jgi:hypothetical protein
LTDCSLPPLASTAAFGAFLSGTQYISAQNNFVNGVIDYLTERGPIELSQLSSAPLTSHPDGIFGVFPTTTPRCSASSKASMLAHE